MMKSVLLLLAACLTVSHGQFATNSVWTDDGVTIIHLFEWTWVAIEAECKGRLKDHYFGVQVSPPSQSANVTKLSNGDRPWWDRYQPTSYNLDSTPSGTEAQFISMVQTCHANGVQIYADIVVNHMTGNNYPEIGWAGDTYDYNAGSYPNVAYSNPDFHNAGCSGIDYSVATQVRNCDLVGLKDLNQSNDWVRLKIKDYLNALIDIGVAGFRMDACKHMATDDLEVIYNSLNTLNPTYFTAGSKPFIYQEVIDTSGTEAVKSTEYNGFARVTEFKFGLQLSHCVTGSNNQQMYYLSNFGEEWGFLSSGSAVSFVDNHDNQRGSDVLTYKSSRQYKIAVGYTLAWPYAVARIMSGYAFTLSDDGPPQNVYQETIIMNSATGQPDCFNGEWICEHGWRQIYNMAEFRYAVKGTPVENWWDNGGQQIAFSRGSKGFVVINSDSSQDLFMTLTTGLADGQYCDVISGTKTGTTCEPAATAMVVTVSNGQATFSIPTSADDGIMAIHELSKL